MTRPVRDIITDLLQLGERDVDPEIRPGMQRGHALLGRAWYEHVRRTTIATIKLHDAGFVAEAAPLRRSLLEHAFSLHWLSKSPEEAYNGMLRKRRLFAENARKRLDDRWTADLDEVEKIAKLDVPKGTQEHLVATTNLLESLGWHDWYLAWASESESSHPSYTTALQAIDRDADDETPHTVENGDGRVVQALMLASEACSQLLAGDPWVVELQKLADEFEAMVDGNLSDKE